MDSCNSIPSYMQDSVNYHSFYVHLQEYNRIVITLSKNACISKAIKRPETD